MLRDEHRDRKEEPSGMLTMQMLLHQLRSRVSILDAKGGIYGSDGLGCLLASRWCSVCDLCFCVWILFYCHFKSRLVPPPDLDLLAAVLDDFRAMVLRGNSQTITSVLGMLVRFPSDP
jgi:hypothetical protein